MPRFLRDHPIAVVLYGTLLVLVLVSWALIARLPDRTTLAGKAARIRPGMSPAQVEAILGCPPGDYRTKPGEALNISDRGTFQVWEFDDGTVEVTFGRMIAAVEDASLIVNNQPVELPDDVFTTIFAWLGF